jgi:transposase
MSQDEMRTQQKCTCWVGLDWGGESHAVSVVDTERTLVAQFKVGASFRDVQQLAQRLRALGTVAGIAIEATRNPLVGYLLSEGFTIYPVNPKMSKSWRESNSVSGSKSDERDGYVLAVELARRHESLRALTQGDPVVTELAGLCEKVRDLIEERTALVLRLKATLRQYYPTALEFFSDWTSPVAWRFIKKFPRPEALAHARKDTLIRFLRANRIGLSPVWLGRIECRGEATCWPKSADSVALEVTALATAAQLNAIQPYIDKYDELIAQRTQDLPQAHLLRTLPGAGERLAPALTAIVIMADHEHGGLEALRCLAGVAPVEHQSGKHRLTQIRRRCNKHWRNTMHLFANCSKNFCPWAKAFYDLCRERGNSHATALRKVADKWLKIIHHMLKTGECYDEQRYLESLRKSRSPIYLRLCEKHCG